MGPGHDHRHYVSEKYSSYLKDHTNLITSIQGCEYICGLAQLSESRKVGYFKRKTYFNNNMLTYELKIISSGSFTFIVN